jgi:hypothetical protein
MQDAELVEYGRHFACTHRGIVVFADKGYMGGHAALAIDGQ